MKQYHPLFFFLLFFSLSLKAQIGFTVAPTQSMTSEWQVLAENYITKKSADFLKFGTTGVIDYTFQLKAPEWQVAPAIHAMRSRYIFKVHDFEISSVGLQANFNFTPFKEGQEQEFSKLRFYFQLSPGVDMVWMQYKEWDRETGSPNVIAKMTDRKLALNGGLNFLMDIPLSSLLKISPMVGLRYYPNLEWSGYTTTISQGDFTDEYDEVNWRHLLFGVRVGWNLDADK